MYAKSKRVKSYRVSGSTGINTRYIDPSNIKICCIVDTTIQGAKEQFKFIYPNARNIKAVLIKELEIY